MIALLFNLAMVVIAIVAIMKTITNEKRN